MRRRLGQQFNASLRKLINERKVFFSDMRTGIFPHQVRSGSLGAVDVAIIESVGITEEGHIIPSASLFEGPTFVQMAEKVIVEVNTFYPSSLEGIHDVYLFKNSPYNEAIPISHPGDRIGTPYIPVERDKIVGIVGSTMQDRALPRIPMDETSKRIGKNLVNFFQNEVDAERLPKNLLPFQVGMGNISDSVSRALSNSGFEGLTIYSGAIGDAVLDLIDKGKVESVSTSGLYFSRDGYERFFENLERYKRTIVIRPIDITDSPEVIQRLGVIAINTAIEIDIYGHVNSSHVQGSQVISGVGGSGEFAQNGFLSIFLTPSTTRNGTISAIVPMVSHVDHSEHTVDIIVTDQGVADLRGLEPVERAKIIIDNCANPAYGPLLHEYLSKAIKQTGGHEPHLLEEAFSFHTRFKKTGTMI
jgi:succinyl-CoA:acetate CoA-transferase